MMPLLRVSSIAKGFCSNTTPLDYNGIDFGVLRGNLARFILKNLGNAGTSDF